MGINYDASLAFSLTSQFLIWMCLRNTLQHEFFMVVIYNLTSDQNSDEIPKKRLYSNNDKANNYLLKQSHRYKKKG